MQMGHENTGEVVEVGSHVEHVKKGDLCSVPFNVACGTCRNCRERHTDVCLRANEELGRSLFRERSRSPRRHSPRHRRPRSRFEPPDLKPGAAVPPPGQASSSSSAFASFRSGASKPWVNQL
jgi:hypothetical protein